MLVLRRRIGQAVAVNIHGIRVWVRVLKVDGEVVKIGFEMPPEAQANREEVQSKIDAIAAGRVIEAK